MEKPLLNNKDEYPSDEVLEKYLKDAKTIWDEFVKTVETKFPGVTMEWRYYNDGKAWLCKTVHKKKTICWISVWDGFFKASFYFTEKNDTDIQNLPILQPLKDSYIVVKSHGKLKPLTLEMHKKELLKDVIAIMDYKIKFK